MPASPGFGSLSQPDSRLRPTHPSGLDKSLPQVGGLEDHDPRVPGGGPWNGRGGGEDDGDLGPTGLEGKLRFRRTVLFLDQGIRVKTKMVQNFGPAISFDRTFAVYPPGGQVVPATAARSTEGRPGRPPSGPDGKDVGGRQHPRLSCSSLLYPKWDILSNKLEDSIDEKKDIRINLSQFNVFNWLFSCIANTWNLDTSELPE